MLTPRCTRGINEIFDASAVEINGEGCRSLTWAGRLDLGLVLFGVRVEEVWRRVLAALYLAFEGVQTLDVLFLERTGRAARRAHIQAGGQLPPLLVLVHLVGDKRKEAVQETESTTAVLQQLQSCLF